MKVTGIAIVPPEAAKDCPKGTPELLASCFAKYSRSNMGIDKIFSQINWNDTEGSIDKIFKFVDYGHASIGGLTGDIAIAVDDASMFIIYKIFEIAQLVDGQESSTRYIKMDNSSLIDPEVIGIPEEYREEWQLLMSDAFDLYQKYYQELDNMANESPELLRIDESLPEKVKDRIRKNFALDRCRYFIPIATKTSAVFQMTARVWSQVIKELASLPFKEAEECAKLMRNELNKFAPRLAKHSLPDDASLAQAFNQMEIAGKKVKLQGAPKNDTKDECMVRLNAEFSANSLIKNFFDNGSSEMFPSIDYTKNFEGKKNRYSVVGHDIKRMIVRCSWNNIAWAELRDLNRHRTGHRFSPLTPRGFYLPSEIKRDEEIEGFLNRYVDLTKKLANYSDGLFLYGCFLGTQMPYEHSTHLDKFIYEIELRTGMGAHFRYAKHYRDAYHLLEQQCPDLKNYVILGEAEPE